MSLPPLYHRDRIIKWGEEYAKNRPMNSENGKRHMQLRREAIMHMRQMAKELGVKGLGDVVLEKK